MKYAKDNNKILQEQSVDFPQRVLISKNLNYKAFYGCTSLSNKLGRLLL
jgi:hypothetical protein